LAFLLAQQEVPAPLEALARLAPLDRRQRLQSAQRQRSRLEALQQLRTAAHHPQQFSILEFLLAQRVQQAQQEAPARQARQQQSQSGQQLLARRGRLHL
jgi:hypothetical protein